MVVRLKPFAPSRLRFEVIATLYDDRVDQRPLKGGFVDPILVRRGLAPKDLALEWRGGHRLPGTVVRKCPKRSRPAATPSTGSIAREDHLEILMPDRRWLPTDDPEHVYRRHRASAVQCCRPPLDLHRPQQIRYAAGAE